MLKVSVIIPVFNVASYLKNCLDSCLASTLQEVEFICINDGSTDNSLQILQEYAKKDKRFIVLSQENSGQGITRNRALQVAQGEFVAFVDPDDFISPDLLKSAYDYAQLHRADVVQFNYIEYRESQKKYKKIDLCKKFKKEYNYNLKTRKKYDKTVISEGLFYNLYNQVWNRIYRRDFILKNDIHFATTRNGEDHLFTIGVLIHADEIYYLADYLYTYRVRMGSMCHSWTDVDMDYTFENISQLSKYLQAHNLYDKYSSQLSEYRVRALFWTRSKLRPEVVEKYEAKVKKILTQDEFNSYTKLVSPQRSFFRSLLGLKGN
ncbi:MAG: glycosyltransferase [Elusimicrobiaceae bacterium]|nr:glycosyltransferase [Elusimicrobiaceae bacterium]